VTDYQLQRFLDAQDSVYEQVLLELREGRKRSHWMWFIFPQIAGLGYSATARFYAIRSLEEAVAYLNHPVLKQRLLECTRLITGVTGKNVHEILGSPDDMKFHSCMTLFERAASEKQPFEQALLKYFNGKRDKLTLERIEKEK
jgi:uncharacterized protein (DUF1810 family)